MPMKNGMQLLTVSVLSAAVLPWTARADSLWTKPTNNERGMFADARAKNVGDILTIVVQETTVSTRAQTTTTNKESKPGTLNLATDLVNQFLKGVPAWAASKKPAKVGDLSIPAPPTVSSNAPQLTVPDLTIAGKDTYTGGGQATYRQVMTNRSAVTVVDVLPNGNMVVEGTKVLGTGKEMHYAYYRGVVRAADVLPDNTVLSSNVADARVEVRSEGSLTDVERRGWLLRANDRLRPY
jgi:flagellar L-ring protein precursor FlgH